MSLSSQPGSLTYLPCSILVLQSNPARQSYILPYSLPTLTGLVPAQLSLCIYATTQLQFTSTRLFQSITSSTANMKVSILAVAALTTLVSAQAGSSAASVASSAFSAASSIASSAASNAASVASSAGSVAASLTSVAATATGSAASSASNSLGSLSNSVATASSSAASKAASASSSAASKASSASANSGAYQTAAPLLGAGALALAALL